MARFVMAAKKAKSRAKPKTSRTTKKDLENKIRALEQKIAKLSPPQTQTPPPPPKATAPPPPPPPKPTPSPSQSSPRGSLPKGMAPPPPPQTQSKTRPSGIAEALEERWQNVQIKDTFAEMRAKVTGYTPSPSRYYARNTAPVGKVSTSDWNLQKVNVTGYTQPSNQYFATRQRLAYHPPEKRFTGYGMRVDQAAQSSTSTAPPPPQPSTARGSLPKGMSPPSQSAPQTESQTSRKDDLETYEADYLKRRDDEQAKQAELQKLAAEKATQQPANPARGSLPKGF